MSVVIIGGGSETRAALQELETASLDMDAMEREHAESLLRIQARQMRDLVRACKSKRVP